MYNDYWSFLLPLSLFAIGMAFIGWPRWIPRLHSHLLRKHGYAREPDFIIGGRRNPYMLRWYLTPWSQYDRRDPPLWAQITKRVLPNVYLHHFLRSDDDRALHDHPWFNMSIVLQGDYWEITPKGRFLRSTGAIKIRTPWAAHRVELFKACNAVDKGGVVLQHTVNEIEAWTLFITGPRVREWGFLCPKGWINWQKFGDQNGCEE